jgi:hypothetical protein
LHRRSFRAPYRPGRAQVTLVGRHAVADRESPSYPARSGTDLARWTRRLRGGLSHAESRPDPTGPSVQPGPPHSSWCAKIQCCPMALLLGRLRTAPVWKIGWVVRLPTRQSISRGCAGVADRQRPCMFLSPYGMWPDTPARRMTAMSLFLVGYVNSSQGPLVVVSSPSVDLWSHGYVLNRSWNGTLSMFARRRCWSCSSKRGSTKGCDLTPRKCRPGYTRSLLRGIF